jgi:hypothetical protein
MGRVQIGASNQGVAGASCSADLQSAVSQISNLLALHRVGPSPKSPALADYKSAIQQIENLRYGVGWLGRQQLTPPAFRGDYPAPD